MPETTHQPKCAYCGKPMPQEVVGQDTAWLMEKCGYGLRMIPWNPQSRVIWDLDAFYQFCSFVCAKPMILDFITKEEWRMGATRAALKPRVQT